MNNFLILACKTVALGFVMYFSAGVFGFTQGVSLLLAAIPVVLIVLGIFSGFAFRLVALIFLAACLKVAMIDRGFDEKRVAGSFSTFMNSVSNTVKPSSH